METPPECTNGTNKIKHQPQKTKHLLNQMILHTNLHTNLHFPSTTLLALKYKYYIRIMCINCLSLPHSHLILIFVSNWTSPSQFQTLTPGTTLGGGSSGCEAADGSAWNVNSLARWTSTKGKSSCTE